MFPTWKRIYENGEICRGAKAIKIKIRREFKNAKKKEKSVKRTK